MTSDDQIVEFQKKGVLSMDTPFFFEHVCNKITARVGLDEIGAHTMRKTFGYHFYQKTRDVALLQEIFNHSAPSITLRHIGISQDVMDQALEDFSI